MSQQPTDFYPVNLTAEEIANPHMVAFTFIQEYDTSSANAIIDSWMTAVYKTEIWNDDVPGNLVFFSERLLRLMEAAWLINQMNNGKRLANLLVEHQDEKINMMDPLLYCRPANLADAWDYFPRSLGRKEFINPYKVFSKFFEFHSLAEWKEDLHEMLNYALNDYGIESNGDVMDILSIKKYLNKLVDASYLINIREFEWVDGQLVVRSSNISTNDKEKVTEEN